MLRARRQKRHQPDHPAAGPTQTPPPHAPLGFVPRLARPPALERPDPAPCQRPPPPPSASHPGTRTGPPAATHSSHRRPGRSAAATRTAVRRRIACRSRDLAGAAPGIPAPGRKPPEPIRCARSHPRTRCTPPLPPIASCPLRSGARRGVTTCQSTSASAGSRPSSTGASVPLSSADESTRPRRRPRPDQPTVTRSRGTLQWCPPRERFGAAWVFIDEVELDTRPEVGDRIAPQIEVVVPQCLHAEASIDGVVGGCTCAAGGGLTSGISGERKRVR